MYMYIYKRSLKLSIHPHLKLSLDNLASYNTSYFTPSILALLELSLPYRAVKFLRSTYSSAVFISDRQHYRH